MELEQLLSFMQELDKETHSWGKDGHSGRPGKVYDVDYMNSRRMLTGSEAADIYLGILNNEFAAYYTMMEENAHECYSVHNGQKYMQKEVFVPGYTLFHVMRAPGVIESERILTFGEKQLPTADYKNKFKEFLTSSANIATAKDLGWKDVSNLGAQYRF